MPSAADHLEEIDVHASVPFALTGLLRFTERVALLCCEESDEEASGKCAGVVRVTQADRQDGAVRTRNGGYACDDAITWQGSGLQCTEAGYGGFIDVVKRDIDAAAFCKCNDACRHSGWECLPPLVVTDISLRAADAIGQHLLRDAKALADGLEVVHASIVAPLASMSIAPIFHNMNSAANNQQAMTDQKRAKITDEHRHEAARLKALWDGKQGRRTQAVFGEQEGLGNQANVGHYLNGRSALNVKAAVAFARELGVNVAEFSPRLALEVDRIGGVGASLAAHAVTRATAAGELSVGRAQFLPGFEPLSIPVLAQVGSMGPGEDQLHDEVVVGRLTVSPQWVTRTIKPLTKIENLRFIHGYGDSMEPTFSDGDILLVDAGVGEARVDGIYVLEANDRIYIKRVRQRLNGSFEVSSDNPTVKTVDELNQPGASIRGRVVWAWNGKKL